MQIQPYGKKSIIWSNPWGQSRFVRRLLRSLKLELTLKCEGRDREWEKEFQERSCCTKAQRQGLGLAQTGASLWIYRETGVTR